MKPISNIKVYDLEESMRAAGYSMRADLNEAPDFTKDWDRAQRLTKASRFNAAHAQFLTGIIVNFDLTFSNKAWVEAERYRFLNFVSSQSTMHCITKFGLCKQCNEYVDERIITIVQEYIDLYNSLTAQDEETIEFKKNLYLKILYNLPSGFQLTARMTTNYRCLLNIYNQRHDHRLPEWREFCKQLLEELPFFRELVEAYMNKEIKEE
jgi:hypothetical protein